MLPEIALVEAALSVIGIRTLITRKVERITKGKLAEIAHVPKDVERMARQLVTGKLEATFRSDLNYRATLKDLAAGWDEQQVSDMIEAFPPAYQAVGTAIVVHAKQIMDALMQFYPTSVYQTVAGATNLVPSDVKIWKFVNILEVLDDPLTVFSLMHTGALLKNQAAAVRAVYPSLSAAIDAALAEATIRAKGEKKSFELPPRAERGVKAWNGNGPIDPKLLRAAQATAATAKARQIQQKKDTADRLAKQMQTPTQRPDPGAP
jgi:hypothetical protein